MHVKGAHVGSSLSRYASASQLACDNAARITHRAALPFFGRLLITFTAALNFSSVVMFLERMSCDVIPSYSTLSPVPYGTRCGRSSTVRYSGCNIPLWQRQEEKHSGAGRRSMNVVYLADDWRLLTITPPSRTGMACCKPLESAETTAVVDVWQDVDQASHAMAAMTMTGCTGCTDDD